VQSFAIGKYLITREQYKSIIGKNSWRVRGKPNMPVDGVSWHESKEFCYKLNKKTGKKYRLPSESEWEYACRAGTTTRYYFGDNPEELRKHAWYDGNSKSSTHPVGRKKPNPWGIYDMYGNLCEWCEDKWHDNYLGMPNDGTPWLQGYNNARVLRGGCWLDSSRNCRSTYRTRYSSDFSFGTVGFRVVLLF
jgi:formylglycine-generating enzyme required for sulfatase activity